MRTWLIASSVLATACSGDPTFSVAVTHPGGFAITQTLVTVYKGPGLTCDTIEFGDRTADELAALTTDEVDATAGGSLVLDRTGAKAIVARGFIGGQRLATAGCQDVGEIAGDVHVEIATVPAAVVAIDPDQAERPFSERKIIVALTDIMGNAIDGSVSWQMYGPAGVDDPAPATGIATSNGKVTLPIGDVGAPGPEGARIRAPWATTTLPLLTAFDVSKAMTIALGGGLAGNPSCAIRGHGTGHPSTVVCLGPTNLQQRRDVVEVAFSGGTLAKATLANGLANPAALFVDHDGSADEPVYAVSSDAAGNGTWFKVGAGSTGVQLDGPLQKLIYVPKCSGVTALVAVASLSPTLASTIRVLTPSASVNVQLNGVTDLASAGCVSDIDGTVHQALVATTIGGDPALFVLLGSNQKSAAIAIKKNAGTGFITTETAERRFVGTRLEAEGTVVFEAVLVKQGNDFGLVERSELAAAAPPNTIVNGRIDSDVGTDLVWDISVPLTRRKLFQVSLSKQVLGTPLTAITSGSATLGISDTVDFVVGDVTGDGLDDVVLYTQLGVTIYSRGP